MKFSIVSTLYQSAAYIAEFHQRATVVAQQFAGDDYEIILVNDGSPDNSCEQAIKLTESDNHVVVIDLSRNFGHHKAIMTGLAQALGEYIFLIDCDLEEEPEWLLSFTQQMRRELCDVVYGVQECRKGSLFERKSGELFYKLFNALTDFDLPVNIVTTRLMTRRYVDALVQHQDREVFLAGLWHITGFTQTSLIVKKHCTSQTTYNLRKKISILVNSVTSFSNKPLVAIFYTGILIGCRTVHCLPCCESVSLFHSA